MRSDKTPESQKIQTQIAIIGGGGAGLAAAVAAAEAGAKVVLLEKEAKAGGNSAKAFGLFAAESPVQKRLNIDAGRDLFFQTAVDYTHWRITPHVTHAFIDKSADTIRWLEEKGIKFDLPPVGRKVFKVTIPPVWHCPQGYGAKVIETLAAEFEELGGRIIYNARARELLTDGSHGIAGVLATKNGEELEITASQVIIATGGYAGNRELLKKYCRYYKDTMTLIGAPNNGDGLLMAMQAGASIEGLGIFLAEGKGVNSPDREIFNLAVQPETVWINSKGKRFVDEAGGTLYETSNAIFRLKNTVNYTLLDEGIKQDIAKKGYAKGIAVSIAPEKEKASDLTGLIKGAAASGAAMISDSLDELAGWMEINPETLNATINQYNTFCKQGYDGLFLKNPEYLKPLQKPPYYAIKCAPRILNTMGGIKISPAMEALDKTDNPIRGLYVVGADAGGWEPDTYSLWLMAPLSGFLFGYSFGFAVNSGRIAGEKAAQRV